jgi:hypothetical protein
LFFTKLADRSTGRGNTEGVSLEIDRGFEDLRPFDTGLVLPPTGGMSSELGKELMLKVKSGLMTVDGAIEYFSDVYNAGPDSSQQKQISDLPRVRKSRISFKKKFIEKLKRTSSTNREESTSQDEKECGTRREGKGMKKKTHSGSRLIRERIFTVSSNDTNTSDRTQGPYSEFEDDASIMPAPEQIEEDKVNPSGSEGRIPAPFPLPFKRKSPRSPRLKKDTSKDSGVFSSSSSGAPKDSYLLLNS